MRPDRGAGVIRVVVCDDHGVVRAGLEQLLGTFEGVEVVAAAGGGEEALAAIAAARRPTWC